MDYVEENPDLAVTYTWHDTRLVFRMTTHRGVLLELVDRPVWGLSCFMDRVVQSCEADEAIYHKALLAPVHKQLKRGADLKVCILGGGEGATAREVLKSEKVASVEMIEWDHDVIEAFSKRFTQWGKGAWDDARLTVTEADVFKVRKGYQAYDAVIVDLFEPEDTERWFKLLERAASWAKNTIMVYAGTHAPFVIKRGGILGKMRKVLRRAGFTTHISSEYVPSFQGYAVFLMGSA